MRSRLRLLVARRRLGRRGALLSLFGALYLLYGYGLLAEPLVSTVSFELVLRLWSLHTWGWLWVAAGAAAVCCAWLPAGRDWLGFAALYPMATAWGLSSFVSWLTRDDNPRGWVGAAIWVVLGGVITVGAGWPEPGRASPARKDGPDGGV